MCVLECILPACKIPTSAAPRLNVVLLLAACLWRRMDESLFPVASASETAGKLPLSVEEDTRAALSGAGGGLAAAAGDGGAEEILDR